MPTGQEHSLETISTAGVSPWPSSCLAPGTDKAEPYAIVKSGGLTTPPHLKLPGNTGEEGP